MDDLLILPRLRGDLSYRILESEVGKLISLIDPHGYAIDQVQFPLDLIPVFSVIDGKMTLKEFKDLLVQELEGAEILIPALLDLINHLDHLGYMESDNFDLLKKDLDDYLASDCRHGNCAGSSYPIDKLELQSFLDNIIKKNEQGENYIKDENYVSPIAIIAPHIDVSLKESHSAYSTAYQAISKSNYDLIVILGTSHFSSSSYFMFTRKNYASPLNSLLTDQELLTSLQNELGDCMIFDDLAHRFEHSIEFQTLFTNLLFENNKVEILPVLTGSLHGFIENGEFPSSDVDYMKVIHVLKTAIEKSGKKVLYIAGADFGHIGRKFEDDFDAVTQLDSLKNEDMELLASLERASADDFFSLIESVNDKRNICGLAPIYAMLQLIKPAAGRLLHYGQWNEGVTASAVSFASMDFYEK